MGKLVQVATETVTSPVASVTLTGIDSDDVYMVAFNNVVSSGTGNIVTRFLASSSPDTSANYDNSLKRLRADSTFDTIYGINGTYLSTGIVLDTDASYNGVYYLFNFNNASEYSFITFEDTNLYDGGTLHIGGQGGGTLTVSQATNGIQFYMLTAVNITSGTFTLYKVL